MTSVESMHDPRPSVSAGVSGAAKDFFPAYAFLIVLLLATALRVAGISTWSLWQDEETSIYFSQRFDRIFAQSSLPYFATLHGLYQLTGISVAAGRALSAAFGLASIWLAYRWLRRRVSRDVAVLAAAFLAVALGHIFLSQSIRYYTMVLAVEVLALDLFYTGTEEASPWRIVAAAVLMIAAMRIHFTAVLLVPVCVGYLMLSSITTAVSSNLASRSGQSHFRGTKIGTVPDELSRRGHGWRTWLALVIPLGLGLAILLPQFFALQRSGATGPPPVYLPPTWIIVRIAAYYGLPMLAFPLLLAICWKQYPLRAVLFLLSVAVIPVLELMVMGMFRLANLTWYHGFISILGWAGLAAMGLLGLHQAGRRRTAVVLMIAAFGYYGGFLALYYTQGHGDRSRWREVGEYLLTTKTIRLDEPRRLAVYSTVPGVLSFYLGVPADKTMEDPLVQDLPPQPPATGDGEAEWYTVVDSSLAPQWRTWLPKHCELAERLTARTGPIDRSISIYRRRQATVP